MSDPHTRRSFLRSIGVALSGVVAGCNGDPSSSLTNEGTTRTATQTATTTRTGTADHATAKSETEGNIPSGKIPLNTIVGLDELSAGIGRDISSGRFFDVVVQGKTIICAGTLNGSLALIALDSSLRVQWSRVYSQWQPVGEAPGLLRVSQSADGGFLLGAMPTSSEDELGVFKTDSRGRIKWERKYDPSSLREPLNTWLVAFGDGSYAYSVTVSGPDSGQTMVHGFDDPAGPVQWEQAYGDVTIDAMASTADGGCLLTGSKLRTGFWMAKLNSAGTEQWQYTTSNFDYRGAKQTPDGEYILWGTDTKNGEPQGLRVKVLDSQRREQWAKTYEEPDATLHTVGFTEDSGYLLASGGKEGVWLTKVASDGNAVSKTKYSTEQKQPVEPTGVVEVGHRSILTGEFRNSGSKDIGWILSSNSD